MHEEIEENRRHGGIFPLFRPARIRSTADDKKDAKEAKKAAKRGFDERLGRIGSLELIYLVKVGAVGAPSRNREAVVSIAGLHKMAVHALQKALVREASETYLDGRMEDFRALRVGELVNTYCECRIFLIGSSKESHVVRLQ